MNPCRRRAIYRMRAEQDRNNIMAILQESEESPQIETEEIMTEKCPKCGKRYKVRGLKRHMSACNGDT